jgi:protease PrsW
MNFLILNVLLAAVPSVLLVVYFYRRDIPKREPVSLIWKTFLWGFLAVLPAAAIEQIAEGMLPPLGATTSNLINSFVVAAAVEEISKFLVVRIFIYRRKEMDEVADGIVYTITAGLGFAFFENILYSAGPTAVIILRGITAVPLHAVAAGIMGYYIGRSRFLGKPVFGRGILLAVLFHGLYDYLLFGQTWASLLILPLLVIGGRVLAVLWRKAKELDREAGRT